MLVFCLQILFSLADLPVHCTYKEIVGEWVFTLDRATFEADLHKERTYCGHGQPDEVLTIHIDEEFSFKESYDAKVTLSEPNIASSAEYGEGE